MKEVLDKLVGNHLTTSKTVDICTNNGYTVTGFVLHDVTGKCCIVDLAAVRWLSKEEMWGIMHPKPTSLSEE